MDVLEQAREAYRILLSRGPAPTKPPAGGTRGCEISELSELSPLVWDREWRAWIDPRERASLADSPFRTREPGEEG
jgi:hypothetical protein